MKARGLEALGEPHLRIAGLRIWVHGRQFPNADDYWDGNWLRVTAYCIYPESTVRTHGAIIHLGEVVGLHRSCKRLYETLKGEAALNCIEPNLNVSLKAGNTGHIEVRISITPDQMSEEHLYRDTIDQSYLPPIMAACEAMFVLYPLREPEALKQDDTDA